ncbi:hypothetical protein AAG570_013555, partial [Ranatra chinensis]
FQSSSGHFLWDEATQGLILSAFFWGYCVTYLPCGLITQNIGGKIMISAGILASSVCTLLIPIIVETYGAVGITILRFIIGLSQGPMFPGFNVLLSQWAPKKERGRLGAIVFAGSYLGSAISLTLSGIIIYSWSWKTVFYIFGSIGLIWLIFWQFICYEQPSHHPFISETELSYLNEEITKAKQKDIPPVPWKSILTSLPLWSLVIVQFGHDWGLFTVVADLPKYMRGVIHFSVTENGLLSSAPYLVMWLFAVACGWTIDWLVKEKNIDLTTVHKIFGTIGAIGPAAGIVGASYCGGHKTLVATLFAVAFGLMGAYVPSVWLGTLALNPNYAGTVTSLVGGIGSTSGVFAPYVVGILTPNVRHFKYTNQYKSWGTLVLFSFKKKVPVNPSLS